MTAEQVREAIIAGFIETGRPLTAPLIAERLGTTLGACIGGSTTGRNWKGSCW
jgi:hypothetical protein